MFFWYLLQVSSVLILNSDPSFLFWQCQVQHAHLRGLYVYPCFACRLKWEALMWGSDPPSLVPGNTLQRNSASSLPVFLEMDFHQALTNSLWLCSSGKIGVCNNPNKCWLYHSSPLLIQLLMRVLAVYHFSRELLFYISCSVSQTTQVLHFNSQKVLVWISLTGNVQQAFCQ